MCGIAGLINCGNLQSLSKMTEILAHRGPDDSGVKWFSKGSGLGHRRLSIIDLSKSAHQPMTNKDETLWIVFNGEIYNYSEIRDELITEGYRFRSRSDTEVVLNSYHRWGTECLDKFNGMFAFAIYNAASDELFAARDRLGIKPFYYYQKNDAFVFASEIKSILAHKDYIREPDLLSIQTPIHYQVSPNTGFKNIYKLEAGHYLKFKNGKMNICDIGVLATYTEGISNAIMEYMAMSKPVISSEGGGTAEIVKHNQTGFLVKPKSSKELYEKIKFLLDNQQIAIEMGKSGRKVIEEEFGLGKMVQKFVNVYQMIKKRI